MTNPVSQRQSGTGLRIANPGDSGINRKIFHAKKGRLPIRDQSFLEVACALDRKTASEQNIDLCEANCQPTLAVKPSNSSRSPVGMVLRFVKLAFCWPFVHVPVSSQLQQQPLIPGGNASNACQNAVGEPIEDESSSLTW